MVCRVSRFSGTSFLAGTPPGGFGIRFRVDEHGEVCTDVIFDASKEGGPGILHGGAIAAVLDEAMGVAAYEAGHPGFTVTMTYHYFAHIPLATVIRIQAQVEKLEGRKVFTTCQAVLPDGKVAVSGHGIFVESEQLKAMLESYPFVPDSDDL